MAPFGAHPARQEILLTCCCVPGTVTHILSHYLSIHTLHLAPSPTLIPPLFLLIVPLSSLAFEPQVARFERAGAQRMGGAAAATLPTPDYFSFQVQERDQ
eukprot:scaffold131528_cov20-Tisochrysis_lutea.AAC.1